MGSRQSISEIRAARCNIRNTALFLKDLREISAVHDTHIICFNADMIAGKIHAALAVSHAVRAFDECRAVSNTLEMESLLFAAGSRQITVAASFGVHEGENNLYICCSPVREEVWPALGSLVIFVNETWDTIDPEKRARLIKTFAIKPEEISAAGGESRLTDLVLERVVLSEVNR